MVPWPWLGWAGLGWAEPCKARCSLLSNPTLLGPLSGHAEWLAGLPGMHVRALLERSKFLLPPNALPCSERHWHGGMSTLSHHRPPGPTWQVHVWIHLDTQ
jgi:hypothetical protein